MTARLKAIKPEGAQGELKTIYGGIEKGLKRVPNIFQSMGNFPPAIEAYFALGQALEKGSLSPETRELISLAVSESNNCGYCLAAHTAIGKSMGTKEDILVQARGGKSKDPKVEAILVFAKKFADKRGLVTDADVTELKSRGVTDQEVVEIFLTVMQITFTNYFNHLNNTPVDFPEVVKLQEAAARR